MDVVAAPTACARDTTAGLDPALAAARGRRSPPPPALPPPSCSRLTLRCPHAWSSPLRSCARWTSTLRPPGARPYTGGRPARRSSPLRPCACRRLPAPAHAEGRPLRSRSALLEFTRAAARRLLAPPHLEPETSLQLEPRPRPHTSPFFLAVASHLSHLALPPSIKILGTGSPRI
jgi:hypothetical protein